VKERLAGTEQDLKTTKQLLAEQTALRQAHQETENRLNTLCTELKSTLESTTSDLRGYQEKLGTLYPTTLTIARKDQIEGENKDQWRSVQKDLATLASTLENRISTMSTFQVSKSSEMEQMISSFLEAETSHLDEVYNFVDAQLSLFEKQRSKFETDLTDAKSSGDMILGEIKILREDIKNKVGEGLSGLNAAASTISQGIVDAMVGFQQQVL
jgi:kinesin family protein 11